MQRDDAYQLMRDRMNEVRSLGYRALVPFVNQTLVSEPVHVHNGEVWIDVAVFWADRTRQSLVICGTASGSNTWRMDRLDDKMLVSPADPPTS